MKKLIYLASIIILIGCQQTSSNSEKKDQETNVKSNKTLTLQVEGMTCTGCETAIENKVKGIQGVVDVNADHQKGQTIVEFDSSMVDLSSFSKAIESAGYQVVKNQDPEDKNEEVEDSL
jgi:copper chaperone CopZ